jgi:hypothetical protein
VASQAKLTASVDGELLGIIWMIDSRTMTILTFNDLVRRGHVLTIFIVAIRTIRL